MTTVAKVHPTFFVYNLDLRLYQPFPLTYGLPAPQRPIHPNLRIRLLLQHIDLLLPRILPHLVRPGNLQLRSGNPSGRVGRHAAGLIALRRLDALREQRQRHDHRQLRDGQQRVREPGVGGGRVDGDRDAGGDELFALVKSTTRARRERRWKNAAAHGRRASPA